MLALALRQAWRRGGQVVVLDPRPVALPFDFEHLPLSPGDLNQGLGALVRGALAGRNLTNLTPKTRQFAATLPEKPDLEPAIRDRLAALRQKLGQSKRPVIVCGTDIVKESTPALAADLALLLRELDINAGLFYVLPGANTFGASLLSAEHEQPWIEALEAGAVKALLAIECDPFWDYPDRERLARALDKLELLVVLDYLPSPLVQRADIVLPTLTVFERTAASFVNQEGRLQLAPPVHLGGSPLAQVSPELHPPRTFLSHVPGGEPRTAGEILAELAAAMSPPAALPVADLWDWLGRESAVFANLAALFSPPPGARLPPGRYGWVAEREGHFTNAPATARYLVAGAAGDFRDYVSLVNGAFGYESFRHLGAALRGERVFPDKGFYEGLIYDAGIGGESFSSAQHAGSLGPARLMTKHVDLSSRRRLLDVGGGSGAYSLAFCAAKFRCLPRQFLTSRRQLTPPDDMLRRPALLRGSRTSLEMLSPPIGRPDMT